MNNQKFLKIAGVLLLSAVMLFSATAVTANTNKDQLKQKPQSNMVSYTPTNVPMKGVLLTEGFEGGVLPPAGWTSIITNPSWTWVISTTNLHSGTYGADCQYDPALVPQDEWLITPSMDFRGYTSLYLSFWWMMSYYWGVTPYDNYDLNVKISTDDGTTWTLIWNEDTIGTFTSWQWYNTTLGTPVNLAAYIGQASVKIGFQYEGFDGAQMGLDDILIYGEGGGADTTPPETHCSFNGTLEGDHYISDVIVTITATDDSSGVNYTKYNLDSGGWTNYTVPFTVTTDGVHVLQCYSVDFAGNVEEAHYCNFTIQHPAPPITITIKGGLGVSATIKNTGTTALTNISWTITLDGKLIFVGKTKGDTIASLAAGEEVTVKDFVIGFGKTGIAVEAGATTASATGTVILIFVIGVA
ncbi:MAG: choice-of-anchor J domain-containing protein [Thermoplasmata archaeon]|nr:choice-of-anchor J domain-containing protein [Thermoplasmata archaeon]